MRFRGKVNAVHVREVRLGVNEVPMRISEARVSEISVKVIEVSSTVRRSSIQR